MRPLFWLVRAKRWAQNPPSPLRIKIVFATIAICLLIFAYEYFFGWPEWLTTTNPRRLPKF